MHSISVINHHQPRWILYHRRSPRVKLSAGGFLTGSGKRSSEEEASGCWSNVSEESCDESDFLSVTWSDALWAASIFGFNIPDCTAAGRCWPLLCGCCFFGLFDLDLDDWGRARKGTQSIRDSSRTCLCSINSTALLDQPLLRNLLPNTGNMVHAKRANRHSTESLLSGGSGTFWCNNINCGFSLKTWVTNWRFLGTKAKWPLSSSVCISLRSNMKLVVIVFKFGTGVKVPAGLSSWAFLSN